MSSSNRRIEANRANAKRSTGPKTAEGKAKCSKNATRHGLCAASFVLETENMDEYNDIRNNYVARFNPRDLVEMDLIEKMVRATWIQRRSWTLQNETIDLEVFRMRGALDSEFAEIPDHTRIALAFEKVAEKPSFSLLQRYEARQSNEFHRALKTLLELKKNVPLAPPGPLATGRQTDPTPVPEPKDATPDTACKDEKLVAPPAAASANPAFAVSPSDIIPAQHASIAEPVKVMRANSFNTGQWNVA